MAINRFSQGPIEADVQSTFIPLPIDMIGKQIERRQNTYDTAKAFIDTTQEAYYGAKGLTPDTEALRNITSAYDTEIAEKIKEAGDDFSKLKGFSEVLGQKVKKEIMTGQLGAIHNNYAAAMSHMEELKKRRSSDTNPISEDQYNRGMASVSAFGGTVEDGKGGYTKASFYVPRKYIEIGEKADDYGKTIADQYTADGMKFINAASATKMIKANLWNDQEVRENAEDVLWGTIKNYDSLDNATKYKYIDAYLESRARDAGIKLAYMQRKEPKEPTTPTEKGIGEVYTYDLTTKKPPTVQIGFKKPEMKSSNWAAFVGGAVDIVRALNNLAPWANAVGAEGLSGLKDPFKTGREAGQKATEENARVANLLASGENSEVKYMLDKYNIPVKDGNGEMIDPIETLNKLSEHTKALDASSSTATVVLTNNKGDESYFNDIVLNPLKLSGDNIVDLETGEYLKNFDVPRSLHNTAIKDKSPIGALVYSGSTFYDPARPQALPPGAILVSQTIDDKGAMKSYAILPRHVNNEEVFNNGRMYAIQNGYYKFMDNDRSIISMHRGKDGKSIDIFKNGEFLKTQVFKTQQQ